MIKNHVIKYCGTSERGMVKVDLSNIQARFIMHFLTSSVSTYDFASLYYLASYSNIIKETVTE